MKHVVRNSHDLSRSALRVDALAMIESAYSSIDTTHVISSSLRLDGNTLTITAAHGMREHEIHTYDLSDVYRIFVVGCGKIACAAAATVEKILGPRVAGGAVVGLSEHVCSVISTYRGTHPFPSAENFAASAHMTKIGSAATENDLVIALIGGGGSAMLCASEAECEQGARLYSTFLQSGGTIEELNIVRRHIAPLKGGGLAKSLYPARIIGLIFSDVPGGNPEIVASGPTYPDLSTITDAKRIIETYNLGSYELTETPKDAKYFERVENVLLVSNETALHAAAQTARSLGYGVSLPSCDPYAPCDELVECMQSAARARTAVCFGGEPRLTIAKGARGSGGRCSFAALEALDRISNDQVFAACASDGHDNGDKAGAIVDRESRDALARRGVDLAPYRASRDSNTVCEMTNDLIDTGDLECNVSDFFILLTK